MENAAISMDLANTAEVENAERKRGVFMFETVLAWVENILSEEINAFESYFPGVEG